MLLPELVTYAATQSIGTAATDLFYGLMPDSPDACVSLFEYGGLKSEPDMGGTNRGTTLRLVYPRVQAMSRGVRDDYDNPRLKLQALVTAFMLVVNQNLSGVAYKAIEPLQDPFFLKRDDQYRIYFVVNFQITKAPSLT